MRRGGYVWIVGAGPGDPELITLKGLRALRRAEAVVYDRLICPGLLEECEPEVELYPVGKAPGGPSTPQAEINALLLALAADGKRVVRLKGGDPFIFGRGGEEVLALRTAGVPFEIVPGVSSALAAPAAIGIPLTHRGVARSIAIATGHDRDHTTGTHSWESLVQIDTLVFLMAMEHIEQIVQQLLAHGRSAEEPAAVVEWATTPWQRCVSSPLKLIPETVRRADMGPPAVLITGPTVAIGAPNCSAQASPPYQTEIGRASVLPALEGRKPWRP